MRGMNESAEEREQEKRGHYRREGREKRRPARENEGEWGETTTAEGGLMNVAKSEKFTDNN